MTVATLIKLAAYVLWPLLLIAALYVINNPKKTMHKVKIIANKITLLWLYFKKPK